MLEYSRHLGGERIAQRSVAEIERLGYRDATKLARWAHYCDEKPVLDLEAYFDGTAEAWG